jgi:hypothetical protein
MRKPDKQRFAALVSDFIAGCGLAPPLYLIAISTSNGSVVVSRYLGGVDFEEVCSHTVGRGMVAPILLSVVSERDGRSAATKIEVEVARADAV